MKILNLDDADKEFWYTRELMIALDYSKWGNFKGVIDKAILSCKNSGISAFDCFAEVGKPTTEKSIKQLEKEKSIKNKKR